MTLVIRFEAGLRPILKHQEHDQSSHGSWANSSERSAKKLKFSKELLMSRLAPLKETNMMKMIKTFIRK
jgi:hypothetical protein